MKTILLPTDFSDNSKNALDYAFELFKGDDVKFLLMHGYHVPQGGVTVLTSLNDIMGKEATERLEQLANHMKDRHPGTDYNVEAVPVLGDAVSAIRAALDRYDVDMIVMGTKGATGLKEVFLGSNTSTVIKHADCAVLAIPEDTRFTPPVNIVFAADYHGNDNEKTLEPMIHIAKKHNAKVMVINVKEEEGVLLEVSAAAAGIKLHHDLETVDHDFAYSESEDIAEGVMQYASATDASMMVTIARKHSFFENLFHTSIAKKLAAHTELPLLALAEVKS